MTGRGNLLRLFHEPTQISEHSASSEEITKDSGLEITHSISSGEYRRLGRKTISRELGRNIDNVDIPIGRGCVNFLECFRSDPQNSQNVINSINTLNSSEICETTNKPASGLFCPNVIQGIKGTPVNLVCNYIELKSEASKGVYLYEVSFHPPVDSTQLRIKYLNEHKHKIGGVKIFDGSTLYLPILLDDVLTTFCSQSIEKTEIEIRVLFKRKESLTNCLQLYNALFDRVMKILKYVKFDRKNFDPSRPKVIPMAKLDMWPGFVTTVDVYDGGLMLCCDVSYRLLCQKTVLEMLIEIYKKDKIAYQANAKKYLIGNIVLTRYNNRTYKIDDICFSENPHSKFETKTGLCSYLEYYKNHHNIDIKDEKQPLIISLKSKKKDFSKKDDIRFSLIPELCFLTGLQDEIRSDKKLMREISSFTRVSPNQRMVALNNLFNNITNNDKAREVLENWGLSLVKNNQSVIGRKIDYEQIYFAKKSVSIGPTAEFSKDAAINEILDVVDLNKWILIHHKSDLRSAKTLINHMERCCEAFGMQILKPHIVTLELDRIDSYVNALRRNLFAETQIAVCICSTSRDDRYSAIKKICCSEVPVASQVINSKTLLNEAKNRSIVQKILLQINCKMGGALWTVKIPLKNVMICGIDSYHDPCQKRNSVSALVASLDSSYTHWYSKSVIQSTREELVNGLISSFKAALQCYKNRNKSFPESVIVYRDGVGDGQLNFCNMYEIPQFSAACNNRVKITFIVVQKSNNTRFFSESYKNFSNPLPGTVVDKHVTRLQMYDFFLVPQIVRQGTVSPTHFIILKDDANYGPDIIQKLSYKLCFLYYNWPGTVRIPACCMYAHKMAYFIGESVQRDTAEILSEKLFYL
ncbi:hypothetical protein KR222_004826 [Zaprionus bogoriensis]|nr:hypothetical protein KR222_004826 [Zaprionus bogoriensis]